ncbi:acetolactate synthase AlsS [Actinacidiphila glaucinigra]|uniref:Acetolactate synthase, large subunit n=1 Tax=Actinacidiphila glaucinigra TaxID=235986 RepID=A0A239NGT3_9ACTN|nr:acetolactate synthase AlsS [Actinacidiphila glaucinigra]SNT53538.1 acetolactate synthase, large subunit [Actinacidiphila glaucinigra]
MTESGVRAAQRAVEVLSAYGVSHIFGVPGAKIDAIYDALVDGGPQLVVCRHEQNAAFMAAAVGRLTGVPGAIVVTSGPGTSNSATGLLTANTEQDPVVALCGAVPRADRLKRSHQSMDATAALKPFTKYTGEVNDADNVPEAVANALRAAVTEPRGAAAVVLPSDVLMTPTSADISEAVPVPEQGAAPGDRVEQAARLIREAKRPVLLVGLRGAGTEACAELRALLEVTDLPVVETFQAAGVVSRKLEDHYVGRIGLFRNQPGDIAISHADLLVTVGFDAVEYDPKLWNTDPGRTVVHIDALPADIDNHYRPAIELRGDIPATLRALTGHLSGLKLETEVLAEFAEQRRALKDADDAARSANHTETGLNPVEVILTLRDMIDDDATVTCDIGSHYIYMARHFRAYEPRHLLFSNGQQTLGVALPWAMAACIVRPGKQVVSVSGDGGFLFSAQELETATRLGLHFTHVILRDNSYDMVRFQEKLKYGRTSGVLLGDYDIAQYAGAFGAHGYRVETEEQFAKVLGEALSREARVQPGVTIIDVPVDYTRNTELFAELHEGVLE